MALLSRTVEMPPVFSSLSVSLTRQWDNGDSGSEGMANVPLVCFGFDGPPLSMPARGSLLEAAISAGAAQNASATGECAWFNDTMVVNVTNVEVRAGTLHIGIFSEAGPTRTQSKMIPRGAVYPFELDIRVFWCGTKALAGQECNLEVNSLLSAPSLHSSHAILHDKHQLPSRTSSTQLKGANEESYKEPSRHHFRPEAAYDKGELRSQMEGHKPTKRTDFIPEERDKHFSKGSNLGWSDWISPTQQCVRLDNATFYSLQIIDFLQELEIKYDCISNISYGVSNCEEFESRVKEERIPLLHLRFGALPGKHMSDFRGEPSTGSIVVTVPKRGWWYLGIFDPTVLASENLQSPAFSFAEKELCLQLSWRARTCESDVTGNDCQWLVAPLERILTEEVESPFDSFFYPRREADDLDDNTDWFSYESVSNASAFNDTVEQWIFGSVAVPNGAAGAVLTITVQTPLTVSTELYARHEGCPTDSNWDYRTTEEDSQLLLNQRIDTGQDEREKSTSQMLTRSSYKSLSLSIIYPIEGVWCVGLRLKPRQTAIFKQATAVANFPDSEKAGAQIPVADWMRRWKLGFQSYSEKLSSLKSMFSLEEEKGVKIGSATDLARKYDEKLASAKGKMLRIALHGCPRKCSGHGSCLTAYEASRLHFISYCQCDVIHGGFDCSATILGHWRDLRQRLILIFSNSAAILPSIWSLRHHAYSEWMIFTLSGISSAIYHSCDAGGWCAMSFSTLQFLDFWLSFLVIIMTCLLIAGFSGPAKAMLHIGCAVLTAAVAKENATSGWSILVVVFISSTGLLLGWGLETRRISSRGMRWHVSPSRAHVACLQLCQRLVRSFYTQLKDRFKWSYLCLGLALLLGALVSNMLELPKTYWIWHSLWHICIYTCAFVLLCSINTEDLPSGRRDDPSRYQGVSTSQQEEDSRITDSHDALVLELDSYADEHTYRGT